MIMMTRSNKANVEALEKEIEETIATWKATLAKEKEESKAMFDTFKKKMEKDLEDLQREYKSLIKSSANTEERLEKEIETLKAQVESLQSQSASKGKEKEEGDKEMVNKLDALYVISTLIYFFSIFALIHIYYIVHH
jgi:hypothetical protein